MKKLYFYLPILLLHCLSGLAQSSTELPIGRWKSHLPFRSGIYVTQSEEDVFYATPQAVLVVNKAERSLQRITKVEGLSRVGVSFVKYSKGSKVLMVVYEDGVIDLLDEDGGIRTLLNLPESNIVLGEKKILDITMANDSIAFLAANYGVSTLNMRSGLFPNTIKTPVEVRSVQEFNGQIYASTPEGVYFADPQAGYNLDDFSNWGLLGSESGLPQDYEGGVMCRFNGHLMLGVNDSIYAFDGEQAAYYHHHEDFDLEYLSAEGAHLIAGYQCPSGCIGKVALFDEQANIRIAPFDCVGFPKYAIEDEQGTIWYADRASNFRVEGNGAGTCDNITLNSPYSTNVRRLAVANNKVWYAAGGVNLTFTAQFFRDGFSSIIDGQYQVYNADNQPAINQVFDFMSVAVHPQNGKVHLGAWLDALVVYDPATGEIQVFNETNSSLGVNPNDPGRSRVGGIAFDQENNLWACNNAADKPLSVLWADGTWQAFNLPCTGEKGSFEIAVDDFGYKWLSTTNASIGVIVFDEGDPNVAGDDRCRILNTSNSVLPTNEIYSIKVDLDGAVWVGTKEGAVVFQCDPFGDCPGARPFVEVDGFGANLLEDQTVNCIGIDGANRKWFGTTTGLFVMSPEGNEQIAHFTAENSPLFDNQVVDVAFNHESGEAYIATAKGLISYRSDATGAEDFHNADVFVFPNPVRPDYEGPIAIKGLAQDATVKIVDVSGQLVFETEALGGQAIWDGRDYNGRKANTGVYLVFATSRSTSNPEVAVAKILVVN